MPAFERTAQQKAYNDAAWQAQGNTGASPARFFQDAAASGDDGARVDGAQLELVAIAAHDAPSMSALTELIATTSALPTAADGDRITGFTWRIEDGAQGVRDDNLDAMRRTPNDRITFTERPAGVFGFLVRALVDGAMASGFEDQAEAVILWNDVTADRARVAFGNQITVVAGLQGTAEGIPAMRLQVEGNSDVLPANSTVALFYLRAGPGEKGDKGDAGEAAEPHQLDPSVSLPNPDSEPAGALRAYHPPGGQWGLYLNEPLPSTQPSNTAQGTAAESTQPGVWVFNEMEAHGERTSFQWFRTGAGANGLLSRLFVGKRHAGDSPPSDLYLQVRQGQTTQNIGRITRNSAADQTNEYAYDQSSTRVTFGDGATQVLLYADAGYTTVYAIRDERQWVLALGLTAEQVRDINAAANTAGAATASADIGFTHGDADDEFIFTIKNNRITPGMLSGVSAGQTGATWLSRLGIALGGGLAQATDPATGVTTIDAHATGDEFVPSLAAAPDPDGQPDNEFYNLGGVLYRIIQSEALRNEFDFTAGDIGGGLIGYLRAAKFGATAGAGTSTQDDGLGWIAWRPDADSDAAPILSVGIPSAALSPAPTALLGRFHARIPHGEYVEVDLGRAATDDQTIAGTPYLGYRVTEGGRPESAALTDYTFVLTDEDGNAVNFRSASKIARIPDGMKPITAAAPLEVDERAANTALSVAEATDGADGVVSLDRIRQLATATAGRVRSLLSGPMIGNNIANSGNQVHLPATPQALVADLDTDSGIVKYSLRYTLSGGTSTATTGFNQTSGAAEKQAYVGGEFTLRHVNDLPAYNPGNGDYGLLVASTPVYNGAAAIWTLELRFARDASTNVLEGFVLIRKGGASNITFNLSVDGDVILFQPAA